MAEGPEQQRQVRREPPPGEDRPEIRRKLSAERDELNPDPTSTDDEMEALRLDIARTRAEMSESVYALQERMNPQYLRQQATSQLRQGASDRAKGAGSGVTETIRNNPVPAALTGAGLVGLGWLIASGASGSSGSGSSGGSSSRDDSGERYGVYYGDRYDERSGGYRREDPYYDLDDTPEYTYTGTRDLEYYPDDDDDSGSRTGQAREQAQEKAGQAREQAGQAKEQARQRAGQAQQQARQRAQQARGEAQQRAQQAKGGFQRALQESPLSLGALALGIGAAVGFAIPESSKENEIMGETRDQLANRAQQQADETTQRAQRVAKQARESAQEEASRQDLKE